MRICRDWRHACERAGLDHLAVDPVNVPALRDVLHRAEVGEITAERFHHDAAGCMSCSPEQIRQISDAFVVAPYPGAADLLAELAGAGVAIACLSNTNEHHWSLLSEPGHRAWLPMDRLNHRFASHLVRARKPEDAIYAHVEREVGLPPCDILFFDDVTENVEAAQRRGWNAQWIDPTPDDPIPQIRDSLRRHALPG
jgi:putative hydrolase of the HAD superfamily